MTQDQVHRKRRIAFSLLTLFVLITAATLLIGWLTRPVPKTAVIRLRVRRPLVILPDPGEPYFDPAMFDEIKEEHRQDVIGHTTIAQTVKKHPKLPLIAGHPDPEGFLSSHLSATYVDNSNMLEVRLTGTEQTIVQCVTLLNTLATEYQDNSSMQARRRLTSMSKLVESELQNWERKLIDWDKKVSHWEEIRKTTPQFGLSKKEETSRDEVYREVLDQLRRRALVLRINSRQMPTVRIVDRAYIE